MSYREEIEKTKKRYKDLSPLELKKKQLEFSHMTDTSDYIAISELIEQNDIVAPEIRHAELVGKLDELKKPHWTVNPTFWIAVVAAIAGVAAAYFAYRADVKASANSEMMLSQQVSPQTPTPQTLPAVVSPQPQASPVDGAPQATPPKP